MATQTARAEWQRGVACGGLLVGASRASRSSGTLPNVRKGALLYARACRTDHLCPTPADYRWFFRVTARLSHAALLPQCSVSQV